MSDTQAPIVSMYKHIGHAKDGETVELNDIYHAIKDDTWRDKIIEYRSLPKETKEQQEYKEKVKLSFPNFTGSGVFSRRENDGLLTHSGLIFIDLDHIVNLPEARKLIQDDEYTAACFSSISGDGLAIAIRIDPNKHSESFLTLEQYYFNKFNNSIKLLDKSGNPTAFKIDPSCKNVSRTRFVSYDPELYINDYSHVFVCGRGYVNHVKRVAKKMIDEAIVGEVHNTLIRASRLMGGYIAGGLIEELEGEEYLVDCMRTKEGVKSIETEKKKIRDGIANGKKEPISATMLMRSDEENETERKLFAEIYAYAYAINRAGQRWTEQHCETIFTQYGERVKFSDGQIRKIFEKVFSDNEDEFNLDNKPDIIKVEVFLRKNYVFARNDVTQTTEYRLIRETRFREVDENSIFRHVQHIGLKYPFDKLRSLIKSDFVPSYNPFADYFQNLPAWDGVTDHISELANYIKTDDQPFYLTQFKKGLVRSIGCSLYGVENRIVFVYVGEKQNTGKSTFIRFLNPFGRQYYTEAPIRNDKDSSFAFSENFIYNMEELASLNNIEINRLKGIISTASIKERKAYAVNAKEQPRRCNFWGSTNKGEFLIDEENTRWLCFNVESIDWGYKDNIDINAVWSQAYALWHSDTFNPQLTAEEANRRDIRNKNFEINELEKEIIKRLFEVCDPYEGTFATNADILETMLKNWTGSNQLNSKFISKIMKQLGFHPGIKKLHGHTVRGFYVKRANIESGLTSFMSSISAAPKPKYEENNDTSVTESKKGYDKKRIKLF